MSLPTERTEHFVLKEDGKIGWIENLPKEPIKRESFESYAGTVYMGGDFGYEKAYTKYQQSLQSAISYAVEVSNQEEVINQIGEKHALFSSMRNGWSIEKGKIYSLQCSVEIQNKTMGSWTYEAALVTFSQPVEEQKEPIFEEPDLHEMIHKVHEDMEGRYDLTGEDLYTIHYLLCKLQTRKTP